MRMCSTGDSGPAKRPNLSADRSGLYALQSLTLSEPSHPTGTCFSPIKQGLAQTICDHIEGNAVLAGVLTEKPIGLGYAAHAITLMRL